MSNSILTSSMAVPFVAEIESNLPVLSNGNVQFNKEFVAGNGTTIDILIPSYGNTGTGADISGRISDVKNTKVPVTLVQYSDGITLDMVEQALKVSDFAGQIAGPYGAKFASDIQKVAVNDLKLSADNVSVIGTGSGAVTYTDISKGIAALNSARSSGEKFGAMSPDLATAVQNSGINFFQADLKDSFVNGKLGTFRGARCFETPDLADVLSIGAQTITTVTCTAYTEGAATMAIGGTALVGTLKAGQVLNLAGVNSVDIYGNDAGKLYAVTVLADVAAAANAATIAVKPIWWTAGPNKNVTVTPVAKALTSLHAASTTYQTVLFWDKQAFITASAKLKGLAVSEKKGASGNVMNSLLQVTSDGLKGIDVLRWDALLGFAIARSNWVSRVDVKMG